MRLLPEILFVVGLAFVGWGAFTLATWVGLLTVGFSCCIVAWEVEKRIRAKPDGEDKPQ